MNQLELTRLISGSRAGDAASVEALVQAHQDLVYRLAISILDDPAEADEAAQDALVKVIRKLNTFRGEASFTTWLYAITLNVCRGRLRQRRSRDRLVTILQSVFHAGGEDQATPPPEQIVLQRERDAALWRVIQSLSDPLREVIVLRYFHELKLNDIAQITGVTERTVQNRLRSAEEQLRRALQTRNDVS